MEGKSFKYMVWIKIELCSGREAVRNKGLGMYIGSHGNCRGPSTPQEAMRSEHTADEGIEVV